MNQLRLQYLKQIKIISNKREFFSKNKEQEGKTMCENRKMRPVETIPGMGEGKMENDGVVN
jgi:hypothetical protein